MGNEYWANIGYKIKRIDPEDYFLFNVGAPIDSLGLKHNDINVITVTSENRFLYDIIMTNDGSVMTFVDGSLLYLKKQSDTLDISFDTLAINKSKERTAAYSPLKNDTDLKSGVIIGIKSLKKTRNSLQGIQEYSYKSVWISAEKKALHPILETNGILLPRMDGFWNVKENRIVNGTKDENIFSAEKFPLTETPKANSPAIGNNLWGNGKSSIHNNISYVGNDYISIETIEKSKLKVNTTGSLTRLWLVPIDSLSKPKGVKIYDIAGQAGANALKRAKSSLQKGLDLNNTRELNQSIEYEDFGIVRKTGHWIFNGRYSYMSRGVYYNDDYRINLIPPSTVVYYDTLSVPWTAIKDRVPEAIDAFTSPKKDIAIIRTSQKLLVYSIDNGILSASPLRKIKLHSGDSIIMAEWASGKYVQKWEDVFKSDNARIVK
ncbi:MAG TPA: hypothetical protein VHT34_05400 [Clostridia bacterium]|nr:hypothetical protein [Clostridia bacterium]